MCRKFGHLFKGLYTSLEGRETPSTRRCGGETGWSPPLLTSLHPEGRCRLRLRCRVATLGGRPAPTVVAWGREPLPRTCVRLSGPKETPCQLVQRAGATKLLARARLMGSLALASRGVASRPQSPGWGPYPRGVSGVAGVRVSECRRDIFGVLYRRL